MAKGQPDDPMNKFHLTWFDPGAAATGWASFIVDFRAFSRPENYVQEHVFWWDCGEYKGPEHTQMFDAVHGIQHTVSNWGKNVPLLQYEVGGEDFDLVQTIGDKHNILSPVRWNAVMAWECSKLGLTYRLQDRAMRTGITRKRLREYGYWKPMGKDAFAAMQHALTRLKAIKLESKKRPWKLSTKSILNAYYDCRCSNPARQGKHAFSGKPIKARWTCDMLHPS